MPASARFQVIWITVSRTIARIIPMITARGSGWDGAFNENRSVNRSWALIDANVAGARGLRFPCVWEALRWRRFDITVPAPRLRLRHAGGFADIAGSRVARRSVRPREGKQISGGPRGAG